MSTVSPPLSGTRGDHCRRGRTGAARFRRRAGIASLVIVALLLGYLVVVGVLRSRTLTLPVPSGPYPVGRAITTVAAGGAVADEAQRATWIWYPAEARSAATAPPAEYVPDGWFGRRDAAAEVDTLLRQEAALCETLATATSGPVAGSLDGGSTVFGGYSLGGGAAVLACEIPPGGSPLRTQVAYLSSNASPAEQ